ncbi:MAG: hypothetical protein JKY27_03070 [Magnetovibrio sp.]|nr:hypothetical protein [Magnetovibrio sp.]
MSAWFKILTLACLLLMGPVVFGVVFGMVGTASAQVRNASLEQDLFNSVRSNDLDGVRTALDAGANIFATDLVGNRAADVAVDLGLFDVAHYLLSVMDHRRAAQKARTQQPPTLKPAVEIVQARPAPVSQPISQAGAQTPLPIAPIVPLFSGPNPFEVGGPSQALMLHKTVRVAPPKTAPPPIPAPVTLSKPVLRIAAVKPAALTSAQPKTLVAPARDPQSALHVAPNVDQPVPVSQTHATPPTPIQAVPAPAPTPVAMTAKVEAPSQKEPGWFDKMTNFFTDDTQIAEAAPTTPLSRPIEPTAIAVAPARLGVSQPLSKAGSKAGAAPRFIQLNAQLSLGQPTPIKPTLEASSMKAAQQWPCVSKGRWGVVCLEKVTWPDEMKAYFGDMRSTLYRGNKAVVGYEDGRADFMYAVFRSSGFDAVIDIFTQRLGAPDEIHQRGVRPFGQTLEANPVRTWYGFDSQAGRKIVLEIFKYDDQRGTFPVMEEGAVKLSYVGEENIFRYTIPVELQRFN